MKTGMKVIFIYIKNSISKINSLDELKCLSHEVAGSYAAFLVFYLDGYII
jgi:hypothetical protein